MLWSNLDEFKGHSLLQAAREADMAKVKKTLALEIINFKHPQTHETALVSSPKILQKTLFPLIKPNDDYDISVVRIL